MTFLSRTAVLATLGLAACGSDAGTEPYTLTISGSPVMYAAAQDGDGAWQQLTLDASGHATFEVTRGYHGVVAACLRGYLSAWFDADGDQPWQPCGNGAPATVAQVSGAVIPATAVVFMQNDLWPTTDGTYRVASTTGRRDLIATTDGRALIQRDLQLDADRTIDLDVDTDGFALTTLAPTVTGNGATPFTAYTEILTANGTYVRTSETAFAVVPSAQRVTGDRVVIGAAMVDGDRSEIVQREVTAEVAPALTFEPLPALQVDRTSARWGDGWDFIGLSYFPSLSAGTRVHAMATGAWLAASGATALPVLDATLPGLDPTWTWAAAGTTVRFLTWAGIGDISGDYQAAYVDTSLPW